jgi:uncharacterized protein
VHELARYQEGYASVIVSRDGNDLVFWSDLDDYGKSIVSQSRIPIAEYVAKGEGPWPWFDLRDRRPGALLVFCALGIPPNPWTEPLSPQLLAMFEHARDGRGSITDDLAAGLDADAVDACGATPLCSAVRSLQPEAALALIDAGADAGRRIELSALGERFTTILHEIVLRARSAALDRALDMGVSPSLLDSDGATPLHRLDERSDHLNPTLVVSLVATGADVNASTDSGERLIEAAAQRLLPATVTKLLDLGAEPANAITAVLVWWAANVRWAKAVGHWSAIATARRRLRAARQRWWPHLTPSRAAIDPVYAALASTSTDSERRTSCMTFAGLTADVALRRTSLGSESRNTFFHAEPTCLTIGPAT